MDHPTLKYSLVEKDTQIVKGGDHLSVFCGSLIQGACPLTEGENVTYSISTGISVWSKIWSFTTIQIKEFHLWIDFSGNEKQFGKPRPLFRIETNIELQACYFC